MTHNEYLDYVMIQYGEHYHTVLEKMKKKEKLDPILISWYDKEYYKKNKIYKLDLYKFNKANLLASHHMKYTHIPVIIEKTITLSEEEEEEEEEENPSKKLKSNF